MEYSMTNKSFIPLVLVTSLLLGARTSAQTSANPDLSFIARFIVDTQDGKRLAAGVREFSRPDLRFEELEFIAQSYLNPFAKGTVVLTLSGPDVELAKLGLEELYADVVRGLPLDLNLRVGKYRAEFGKFNTMHPHAWQFVTQPLSHEVFFGEEGLNELGISLSALLPTGDIATKLSFDVLRGNTIGEASGIEDTTDATPWYSNAARLTSFFPMGDESDLELGLSAYTGIHDPYNRERFFYANLDFKYKWKPSSYTSLTIQGEYLLNKRTALMSRDFIKFTDERGEPLKKHLTTSGLFLLADYQFLKSYSIGTRYDWSQTPYSAEDQAQAISFFFGYYPVEETLGMRLHYQHTKRELPNAPTESVNYIGLQFLFSLGPHKAHPF